MDEFTEIPGCPGYKINRIGEVLGKEGRILKACPIGKRQYQTYSLYVGGKVIPSYRHRLMAMTFLPNDDPTLNVVTFINGDSTDVRVENLKWATRSAVEYHNGRGRGSTKNCRGIRATKGSKYSIASRNVERIKTYFAYLNAAEKESIKAKLVAIITKEGK